MTAATLDGRLFEPPLRPSWLRPAVVAVVVALHAAALSIVYLAPPKPLALPREVIVDIEPGPAPTEAPAPPAAEPKPTEQSAPEPPPVVAPAPVEPPPPVVEEPAPPPEPPPPVAEQPPLEAQPPLPPVEAPPPPPAPVELAPPKPAPPPRRIEPRPKPEPVRQRPETTERRRAPEPRRTTASRETGRPETPSHSAPASAASQSAYASEISGAIRSRLLYPPAARARGARGVVGVAFTIGASGAVTSFAITRSSGDRDLDAAARELVRSVRFPPPPGGSAHIATSFNYVPR
jgi:periplasmic protein TonB